MHGQGLGHGTPLAPPVPLEPRSAAGTTTARPTVRRDSLEYRGNLAERCNHHADHSLGRVTVLARNGFQARKDGHECRHGVRDPVAVAAGHPARCGGLARRNATVDRAAKAVAAVLAATGPPPGGGAVASTGRDQLGTGGDRRQARC
jgi:hypothetical protein